MHPIFHSCQDPAPGAILARHAVLRMHMLFDGGLSLRGQPHLTFKTFGIFSDDK
jgi:hypothetical protein